MSGHLEIDTIDDQVGCLIQRHLKAEQNHNGIESPPCTKDEEHGCLGIGVLFIRLY